MESHYPVKIPELENWLKSSIYVHKLPNYYYLLLKEEKSYKSHIIPHLEKAFYQAHQDFRNLIIDIYDANLDPLDSSDIQIEKKNFLCKLDQFLTILDKRTLTGYFGEILTGLAVLSFSPFEITNWEIPVFLYRHHIHAYDTFEKFSQTGKIPKAVVGRAGEDNIAFLRDAQGNVIKELRCEAKCSLSHNPGLISDAHKRFDDATKTSPEIFRILQILRDYDDDESKKWADALKKHHWSKKEPLHLVFYVCGKTPVAKISWINKDAPHKNYKSSQNLQSIEVHLSDILGLIESIYGKGVKP